MIEIFDVIKSIRPGATFSVEDTYESLEWLDNTYEKPSYAEIEANWTTVEYEILEKEVRQERDQLLAETDWIVIRSQELGEPIPTEWQTYRQALRDITEQSGFPDNVEWPLSPTEQNDEEIQ